MKAADHLIRQIEPALAALRAKIAAAGAEVPATAPHDLEPRPKRGPRTIDDVPAHRRMAEIIAADPGISAEAAADMAEKEGLAAGGGTRPSKVRRLARGFRDLTDAFALHLASIGPTLDTLDAMTAAGLSDPLMSAAFLRINGGILQEIAAEYMALAPAMDRLAEGMLTGMDAFRPDPAGPAKRRTRRTKAPREK